MFTAQAYNRYACTINVILRKTDDRTRPIFLLQNSLETKQILDIIDECVWIQHAGVSGNVLIDNDADRVNSYNIWDYAEGHNRYYSSMLVDLTQPSDKVCVTKPIPKTGQL